ncbi:MAG: helix-turn-helix domain-containing protein [Promethearchaeota archaeon]
MEIIDKQLKGFGKINNILEKKESYSSQELFKCILGLNEIESKIFCVLLKNQDLTTSQLTEKIEMDRSSIQKAVKSLLRLKLIKRKSISMKDYNKTHKTENDKKQGYLYIYNAKNIDSIKREFKKLLDKWYNSMLNYIDNLENLCECCGIKLEPC